MMESIKMQSSEPIYGNFTPRNRLSGRNSILVSNDSDIYQEILPGRKHNLTTVQHSSVISKITGKADQLELDDDTFPDETVELVRKTRTKLASVEESKRLIDEQWHREKKHVFVLSSAGKPIFTMHGDENNLSDKFGLLATLVSFVEVQDDSIRAINVEGLKFVFLVRGPLIFVAISRFGLSEQQIQMQLNDVYNLILSIVTLSKLTLIFAKRPNYDLRNDLIGQERLITHLLNSHTGCKKISNTPFTFLTNSVSVLPLLPTIRDAITNAIKHSCSKIKNLVFGIILANNKLVGVVSIKKYKIYPSDLRLLINMVGCTESYKISETWVPICLPKLEPNGHLFAHISYLAENSKACLILLSADQEAFHQLSVAKQKIVERLLRNNCLQAIEDAAQAKDLSLKNVSVAELYLLEMRHFVYKHKKFAQVLCSDITIPYENPVQYERLLNLYYDMHHRIHNLARPLKEICEIKQFESMFALTTEYFELYAVFEPTITKKDMKELAQKLFDWIDKEQETLFILNAPKF